MLGRIFYNNIRIEFIDAVISGILIKIKLYMIHPRKPPPAPSGLPYRLLTPAPTPLNAKHNCGIFPMRLSSMLNPHAAGADIQLQPKSVSFLLPYQLIIGKPVPPETTNGPLDLEPLATIEGYDFCEGSEPVLSMS